MKTNCEIDNELEKFSEAVHHALLENQYGGGDPLGKGAEAGRIWTKLNNVVLKEHKPEEIILPLFDFMKAVVMMVDKKKTKTAKA